MKNNIKKLRTEKRISQQKLAENLGVSRQTINSI
jgi:putative transcriptional regulator